MKMRSFVLSSVALLGASQAAFGISPYFDQLRFVDTVGAPGTVNTTSQQWDSQTGGSWANVLPTSGAGNFLFNSNPTPLSVPVLSMSAPLTLTPYYFDGGTGTASINNYGNAVPALTRSIVTVQLAGTEGATGSAVAPTGFASPFSNVNVVANGITYAPLSTLLLDSRKNAANFGFPVDGVTYTPNAQQFLYQFLIPSNGNFTVNYTMPFHTVFEALRVDTQLTAVPEPTTIGTSILGAAAILVRRRRSK